MKLFDKYNRINVTTTILIFVIGSCSFYFLLNYILVREVDEQLHAEQQEILAFAKLHNTLPETIHNKEQYTFYEPAAGQVIPVIITAENNYDGENERYREIHFTVTAAGKPYAVKVAIPLEETESLLQIIIWVTIVMIALILLAGYFINRVVIRNLWKPFYQTIDEVQAYRLSDREALVLAPVNIDEFALLNRSINDMIGRIQQDYTSLKGFTGQAAHEMQTPLAIIRSKLDMLMQNEAILQSSGQGIADIEKAVLRLSRLHQSLLLLTKVEHRQFLLNEQVLLDAIITEKYREYTELTEAMQVTVTLDLAPVTILFHQHLADILVGNLLSNAIRYNKAGGLINIKLAKGVLAISNTSNNRQLDAGKLFKPFYRDSDMQEGNGLGLSIVKQICDTAGLDISYTYAEGLHTFTILLGDNY